MVTRGEGVWREGEMSKGGQLYGDRWKRGFGSEHDMLYTQMSNYNVAHLELI